MSTKLWIGKQLFIVDEEVKDYVDEMEQTLYEVNLKLAHIENVELHPSQGGLIASIGRLRVMICAVGRMGNA